MKMILFHTWWEYVLTYNIIQWLTIWFAQLHIMITILSTYSLNSSAFGFDACVLPSRNYISSHISIYCWTSFSSLIVVFTCKKLHLKNIPEKEIYWLPQLHSLNVIWLVWLYFWKSTVQIYDISYLYINHCKVDTQSHSILFKM